MQLPRNLLIVACLLFISSPAFSQNKKQRKKQQVSASQQSGFKEIGSPLPPLRYYRRDGLVLTNSDLKENAPIVIMLFNPTCDHCEEQARRFQQHLKKFRGTNLLLMAADRMGPHIGYFVNTTGSDNYPSLQIGIDSSRYIDETFRYAGLPQINVYDQQRKLVKVFAGLTPIDSILGFLPKETVNEH